MRTKNEQAISLKGRASQKNKKSWTVIDQEERSKKK